MAVWDADAPQALAGPFLTAAVGWWLLMLCAMAAGMVMLGGYTRLTHSGLSMVRRQLRRRPAAEGANGA